MLEASEDTDHPPATPPNLATVSDTSIPQQSCTPEPGTPDERTQDAKVTPPLELSACDGADPEAQENGARDDSERSNDSDSEPLDLDSILPMAKILTSVLRIARRSDGKFYYFEGVPTAHEMGKLEAYVKRVQEFTLNKATLHGFPFGTILRLSTMRNWHGAFLKSLKVLCVVDCDEETVQSLSLFLSPSLESLEVRQGDSWDTSCHDALDSFIVTLSSQAPNLTCLKISSSESASWQLFSPITPTYSPFDHLRTLHLKNVVIDQWAELEALGELESLEDLNLITVLRRPYCATSPTSPDGGEWNVLSDCLQDADRFSSGFDRLKSLCVAARIEVLRDLLGYIESNSLTNLSITLLASSRETQSLESFRRGLTNKKPGPSDEEAIALIRNGQARFTFRNEDEFFCLLLDRAAGRWQDLQAIAIDHRQPLDTLHRDHILSASTAKNLLHHPRLRQLEISDWVTDFDVGELLPPTPQSNLQTLHLPTNASSYKTTEGIPWTTLAAINEKFPSLTSFHGYLKRHISDIPDYTASIPDEISPNRNVETLALGNGPITWDDDVDSEFLLRVGVYLYSLFPHLETIAAQDDDESPSGWGYVKRLVKMCQASSRFGNHNQL